MKRHAPNFLTLDEAERLVRACPRRTVAERRDRLMILLLYGCGLRTAELCALDVSECERERQELTVLQAKGDRPRVLPIPDGVYSELLGISYSITASAARCSARRTSAGASARSMCASVCARR